MNFRGRRRSVASTIGYVGTEIRDTGSGRYNPEPQADRDPGDELLHLEPIRQALARHCPQVTPLRDGPLRAAVALVLAGPDHDLRLCFIRRVERRGDPWSGDMALPGGRAEPGDASAEAVAERETREEVGLVLDAAHRLGALSELPVVRVSGPAGMVLSSFVYYLGPQLPDLRPNHEVAAAWWIPLRHLWDPGNRTHLEYEHRGRLMLWPGIRFRDQVIWGLSLRVLNLFSDVLDHPLPHVDVFPRLKIPPGRDQGL